MSNKYVTNSSAFCYICYNIVIQINKKYPVDNSTKLKICKI